MEFDYEKRQRQQRKYEETCDYLSALAVLTLILWVIVHFFGK